MMQCHDLVFVTGNGHKAREVEAVLGRPIRQLDAHGSEPQSLYLSDIVNCKASNAWGIWHRPLIVEDTSLMISAVNGLPGPLVKHFIEKTGPGLLVALAGLNMHYGSGAGREAKAFCDIAYVDQVGNIRHFVGLIQGTIATEPRGKSDFGFDTVFIPDGHTKTFAEMTFEEKNAISHRGNAVRQLKAYLDGHDL